MTNEWILPPGLDVRLAKSDDEEFLFALFCSARPELALAPLPPAQLMLLLQQQYELQKQGYTNKYPHAENWIITTQSGSVGKVMLDKSTRAVHVIDIVIAPDWRKRGVGSTILVALKAYVDANAGVLSLHVEHQNIHAKRLYQRLGFVMKQSTDTHESLVWSPIDHVRL